MKSTIRLFKAVPVNTEKEKTDETILNETVKYGFVLSPKIIGNYQGAELLRLINNVKEELGLSAENANSSFHKSWRKIKEASIEQLVIEQIIHYFTTYGFEALGVYSNESIYIPHEKLEIPAMNDNINLIVINGYTKNELKSKLISFLQSGIALKDETIKDVIDIALYTELSENEIKEIINKETKIALYNYLNIFPENPVEFLRYIVYCSIEKTLLIKDKETIEAIKAKKNLNVLGLIEKYQIKYGLEKLSEIFYRFKPLFLAFRTNPGLNTKINKIRKLAIKHHKPFKDDYLNTITSLLKRDVPIDEDKLKVKLSKVNIFRRIRLLYALKFRLENPESILYRIRNGKGYAKEYDSFDNSKIESVYDVVFNSIVQGLDVKDKTIYIPEYVNYSLPATEKQFTGYFPSGTYVSIPKDMIFGIHWTDINDYRVDLDLSVITLEGNKMGWDGYYRNEERSILFSGDMTAAPKPNGASELFYIKRQSNKSLLMFVNYYNYNKQHEVPYKIVVAKEHLGSLEKNYMIDINSMLAVSNSVIKTMQKILGLIDIKEDECRFYFTETSIGKSITASNSQFVQHSRQYLFDFYKNSISLNDVLIKAGATIVNKKENSEIDLSPENLTKDSIINLLLAKKE